MTHEEVVYIATRNFDKEVLEMLKQAKAKGFTLESLIGILDFRANRVFAMSDIEKLLPVQKDYNDKLDDLVSRYPER